MAHIYEIPNITNGIDDAIVGTVQEVSAFTPMLLAFIFFTILLGGSISQKRRTGSIDMPLWMVTASLPTLLVSLILTLRSGIIQLEILSIVVAITIFSGFWLFFDKNRNEV